MLGTLRKKKNSPIILFLLVVIILVFIAFFGTSLENIGKERLYAAKVNGYTITDRAFAQRYSQAYRNYQRQFREFNREQAQQMDLRRRVLDQMITSRILSDEAASRGLKVDDTALREAILADENFHTEGSFDITLYQRILNSVQMTEADYEEYLREQLMQEKLALVINNSITVSSAEARTQWEIEQKSIDLEFIRVNVKPYTAQAGTVTEADAAAWMAKDGSDAEIQKFYKKHAKTRYNVPKKVRARHILVRIDKDAPHDIRAESKKKIKEAKGAVLGGMDFADAAKKYSDDSTAQKGGDLGFFSRGQMVGPFEEAAFGLKVGDISEIIETNFGFHVIKVEEIAEPITRKLEDVKDEIALELTKEAAASTLAEQRAKQIFDEVKGGKTMDAIVTEAAEKPGLDPTPLKVENTGNFAAGRDYVPKIGANRDLVDQAWTLSKESPLPPGPFRLDAAWMVYRLKDKTTPTEDAWTEAEKAQVARLEGRKRNDVLEAWADPVRASADVVVHPLALSYNDDERSRARSR